MGKDKYVTKKHAFVCICLWLLGGGGGGGRGRGWGCDEEGVHMKVSISAKIM